MSTTAHTTEWELKLKDFVSAPFKKITEYATGAQKKTADVANTMTKAAQASQSMGREFKRSYSGLESTLHKLEQRQKNAFSTKHILAYQQLIDKTRAEMERLNSVTKPPTAALSGWASFKAQLSGINNEVPMLGRAMSFITSPAVLLGAGITLAGAGMQKSIDLAVDYDRNMAKINATAQLSADNLGLLKDRLVDLGSHSGGNFELIPEAYEKILSQTGKVNLSLDILETGIKGAEAGFTNIDTVAGALAQTLSVVGEKNTTANEVMDTLLKAKAVGAGEFADFANYLPQLIASGNNLSVNFKDTAGLFAYMTAKGQSAADSAMLLQNAFTALQKNDIIKGLGKKGIQLFNVDGSRRNVKDVFLQLSKVMGNMTDKAKTNFMIEIGLNDAQARNAFSVLTSDAEKFNSIMGDVNDSLGETNKQFEATANVSRTWGDVGDQLKGIGEKLGEFVIPAIDWYLKRVEETFDIISKVINMGDSLKEKYTTDTNIKIANQTALNATKKKFGVDVEKDKNVSSEAMNYYKYTAQNLFDKMQAAAGSGKNNIVKGESQAMKALSNINSGKAAGDTSVTESSTKSGSSVSGDGAKVRNLVMNLSITNHFKSDDPNANEKIKQKLTDLIVDSARDGMVTIGV
ncbi:MAG: phage tail tape measure protein [Bacteroidia bacterium]|nr:phage tail tape measure protein [Bacteroidia bacterium]